MKKLLDVKSIVTLALTLVFCVLACRKIINAEQFLTIFTTIIAFYFGTQSQRLNEKISDDTNKNDSNPAK